jgi:hypothetical protein
MALLKHRDTLASFHEFHSAAAELGNDSSAVDPATDGGRLISTLKALVLRVLPKVKKPKRVVDFSHMPVPPPPPPRPPQEVVASMLEDEGMLNITECRAALKRARNKLAQLTKNGTDLNGKVGTMTQACIEALGPIVVRASLVLLGPTACIVLLEET